MEKIWLKNYCPGVPTSVPYRNVSLIQALSRTVARFPDSPALIFHGKTLSFRDLGESVGRFAAALRSLGVRPGDRVSIVLPNLVQTAIAVYGALQAGAVVVMHNPRNDDKLLEHQFNDAGSKLVVALDVLIPRILGLRRRTKLQNIISCHIRDYLPFLSKQLFSWVKKELHLNTPEGSGIHEFKDLIDANEPATSIHRGSLTDTAFILYTSATTGTSKGVDLSHANVSMNCQQARSWFPRFVDGEEIVVGCLPFFHVFGLTCSLNIGMFFGFGVALVPLPDARNILEAIHEAKATFIPALPNMYSGMIQDPNLKKYDLKSLKGCFSGGAPLPLEIIKAFEKLTGAQICEGYGLTESGPVTHINPYGGKTKVGTIGLPLPDTDAKIVDVFDETREITIPNEPGELWVRGPQVMKGYVNLPNKTQEALRDGWLVTGDIVKVDEEGYFTVVDRKKDMIVTSGSRIFPRDVDEVLYRHPKVLEACAVGVPDAVMGEAVKAFIVLRKDQKATTLEILDFCKKNLPPEQVPRYLEFIEDLPRNPVGKVLRKELKRRHMFKGTMGGLKKGLDETLT